MNDVKECQVKLILSDIFPGCNSKLLTKGNVADEDGCSGEK